MARGPYSSDYFHKFGLAVLLLCVVFGLMTLYALITYPSPENLKIDPLMQKKFDKAIEEVLRKVK